ncbi:hypothetical protein KIN20_020167 [Parelaphostrongylus tenuis]|uniref:Lipoprotein n=1 Tax=Parelaphostrongylus tenuis TaxID=148309 RepID=A0AAD5MM20_PARTN|nr:hypothetical protein KIN20_020167 [Parelaphostrongylus tenuis]
MERLRSDFFMISLLATISTVLGCGVMPAGQATIKTFNLGGLTTLPPAMDYSGASNIQARLPGIASSEGCAQAFVSRLVMQTVFDVFESQARTALTPDGIISSILGQLEVRITYEPVECHTVLNDLATDNGGVFNP